MRRLFPASFQGRSALAFVLFAVIGCSGSPTPPADGPASTAPTPSSSPPRNGARARLQGTWELVTFISRGPIPEEAIPILATLHGAVRLRFEGARLTTFVLGHPEKEECAFELASENGDSFVLITPTGMFRRAEARFVSADVWEASEDGPTWPGTTRFQRVAE